MASSFTSAAELYSFDFIVTVLFNFSCFSDKIYLGWSIKVASKLPRRLGLIFCEI